MKTPKLLLAGLLAVSALAGTASAQTKIYIAGAPAFRQIGTQAVEDALAATTTGGVGSLSFAYVGTSLLSANSVTITGGTLTKGNPSTAVTVKITYSGSTAAVQSLAAGTSGTVGTNSFKVLYLNDGLSGPNQADPTATGAVASNFDAEFPNFGLTDTFQTTTPFHGTSTLTGSPVTYSTLNEFGAPNAIIAYKFLANVSAPSGLNLTPSQVAALFTSGAIPLSLLTGSSADFDTTIYSVGRDIGSGARYAFLAESGIGPANNGNLYQNYVTLSGSTITGYTASPANTINHISYPAGNGGYPSFSLVLAALKGTSTPSVGHFITYVGAPDAVTAQAAGAKEVSWNGNVLGEGTLEGPSNTAPSNLAEGKYTYWSYIHVPYPTGLNTTNASAYTLAHNVYNDLGTDTATTAILTSDVQVSRTADGAPIFNENF